MYRALVNYPYVMNLYYHSNCPTDWFTKPQPKAKKLKFGLRIVLLPHRSDRDFWKFRSLTPKWENR